MGFTDCCSAFFSSLPDPSLPLLPSLLLGTSFASLILLLLYKKETNLPFKEILLHAVRSILFHVPQAEHGQGERCTSPDCVRCQKYEEMRSQIVHRWRRWSMGKGATLSQTGALRRVEEAVQRLMRREIAGRGEVMGDEREKETVDERNGCENVEFAGQGGESSGVQLIDQEHGKDATLDQEEENTSTEHHGREKSKSPSLRKRSVNKNPDLTNENGESTASPDHEENVDTDLQNADTDDSKSTSGRQRSTSKTSDSTERGRRKTHILESQKPTLFHMSLEANPCWDEFAVLKTEREILRLNSDLIMKEFESVFESLKSGDTSGWKKNDILEGHWCVFPLVDQGSLVAANCRRCPGVAELVLGCLPGAMNDCVFGNVAFSILYPDSHIAPHTGPSNIRLRCHLGLKVPPECWLEVSGRQYRWVEGKTILFDDSFEHSATFSNRPSDAQAEPRAVLMVDFWHPGITKEERECLSELLVPLG